MTRRAIRHEPLGIDLDGRIYYVLSPRIIEDDARPPIGWASGLLVWGGVPRKSDDDELPIAMERWSHFGKSVSVKQLAKWVEWRLKKDLEAMKPVNSPAKPMTTPNGKSIPNGKSTPTPTSVIKASTGLVQSTLKMITPSKAVTTPKLNPRIEVVIPISAKRAAISSESSLSSFSEVKSLNRKDDDAVSTSSSELSTPPESTEDLLALMNPKDYKPSSEIVEENGKELVRRLLEVSEWLEVLEWRGMGEVY